MSFGQPSLFANSLAWPVSFDNLVKPSRGLIELCLKESGFEDIRHVAPISTPFDEIDFWKHHTGIVAFRTSEAATVYTGGAVRRERPADVPMTEPEPANVVENAPAEGAADISAGRPDGAPPEPPTLGEPVNAMDLLRGALQDAEFRAQAAIHARDAVLNSVSWRLTAPLRRIGRRYPKVAQALRGH